MSLKEKKVAAEIPVLSDRKLLIYWQRNIREAAEFFFPTVRFTAQQQNGLDEFSNLISAKLNLAEGKVLTEAEMEYSKKIGLSIQAGNGVGKDAFAAVCILLFTMLFPEPKNLVTANTAKQLKNVLWSEISTWMRTYCRKEKSDSKYTLMEERLELQSEKLFLKELKGEGWFTEAVTINPKKSDEEQATAIAGRHANYQLIVLDEACGIPDAVPLKLEKTLTRKLNLMLLIFNPDRTKGYAIESQHDPRFVALRWSAEDSELVTKEQIEAIEKRYGGRDSNPFRISVLGLPPINDQNTFIPYEWIEEAIDAADSPPEDQPIIMSLDCGAGGDKSVLCKRQGGYVFPLQKRNTPESTDLIGWSYNEAEDADVLVIDKKGIGWSIHGSLKELRGKKETKAYDGSTHSSNQDRWHNLRDEAYLQLRERFESRTISIPNDKELIRQLSILKAKYDGKGLMHIMKKEDSKKIIGHSLDETDALVMNVHVKDKYYRKDYIAQIKKPKAQDFYFGNNNQTAWMGM